MKKILYFDSATGASGDMIVGALIDAGVPFQYLEEELAKLKLTHKYGLAIDSITKKGIGASKFSVDHQEDHHHRHLPDIYRIIDDSPLKESVKILAKEIFQRLATAEAKIHRVSIDKVHFHEVGAIDAIVDIVGACIALDYLNVDEVYASALPVGSGSVKCAHGIIPVPAPATLELLSGVPIKESNLEGELLTPTGAAILTTIVKKWGPLPSIAIAKVGYGAGTKDLPQANVLRVILGTADSKEATSNIHYPQTLTDLRTLPVQGEKLLCLECHMDDLNPEIYPYVLDKVLSLGAKDAYITAIIMKKGRPGHLLTVLCEESLEQHLTKVIFSETSTLGVRSYPVQRWATERQWVQINFSEHSIRIKYTQDLDGNILNIAPEFEDCKKVASSLNLPLKKIYQEALRLGLEELKL